MNVRSMIAFGALPPLLAVLGCSSLPQCVCANVNNASDVITVSNDGGCGNVEQTFTDPRRSCFEASGSIAGPGDSPILRAMKAGRPSLSPSLEPPPAE